jgi:hypothetical protein
MSETGSQSPLSSHQIVVGGGGGKPDWRAALLRMFWSSGHHKQAVIMAGAVLLTVTIGILLLFLLPKSRPTLETIKNNPGQSQNPAAVEEEESGDTGQDDTKKTAKSTKKTGSTSGGSSSSGGSGGGSSGGGSGSGSGGSCPNSQHTPGGPDGFGDCWPYSGNTGIPAGTSLSNYSGGCTVTADNLTLNAKTINCDPLVIEATNVKITKSKINGSVLIDDPNAGYSFTISDSEIDVGSIAPGSTDDDSGIGKSDFVATRVNVHGGKRGVWCEYDCTIQDSWIHDQAPDPSGTAHESGIRMGDGSNIRHNSIWCNAPDYPPDAGCSANLTGYGDFAPIRDNTIYRNLFVATTGGVCAYGGSSGDDGSKPYGDQAANIVFQDNIFQRGSGGKCGFYFPITDFDDSRPGNQWLNNKWDDGALVPPAN